VVYTRHTVLPGQILAGHVLCLWRFVSHPTEGAHVESVSEGNGRTILGPEVIEL
jgi:hypothetical protein